MDKTSFATVKRADLPALTGLRFFAAYFVVFSHVLYMIPGTASYPAALYYISNLSALGMTLFFVLSGFVIHYNYREQVSTGGAAGFWNFFVARFSRLYPLYFGLVVWELYTRDFFSRALQGNHTITEKLLTAGPYYLTLTQSWFYAIVGENNLIYQFHRVGSVAWSISTEWFFYLAYPLIYVGIRYLQTVRAHLLAVLVLSFISLISIYLIVRYSLDISSFALRHYGAPADTVPSSQDSLVRWLIYFSPYSRVTEFILGVLACEIYIRLAGVPVALKEKLLSRWGVFAAILVLGATHVAMFAPSSPFPTLTPFHMCFGYALPVALIIFCVARYQNPVQRLLAWRPIVVIGEASYSLYLLHLIIIGTAADHGWLNVDRNSLWSVYAVIASITVVTLVASLLSYRFFEVPARKWFRKVLAPGPAGAGINQRYNFLVTASRGATLVCLLIAPMAILVFRLPPLTLPPPEGTIEIVEATYGRNCKASSGNATEAVIADCSGAKKCNYVVNVNRLGDPAGGCAKDFDVTWRCGRNDATKIGRVEAEAGLGGKTVAMQCSPSAIAERPTAAAEGPIVVLEATYGRICNVPSGNATKSVAERCSKTKTCEYVVDVARLSDPATGCAKDFDVSWRCSDDGSTRAARIEPEAGIGKKKVVLECGTPPLSPNTPGTSRH